MKWMNVKMKGLGVLGHADFKITFMMDFKSMLTLHTQRYGAPCPAGPACNTCRLYRPGSPVQAVSLQTPDLWLLIFAVADIVPDDTFYMCKQSMYNPVQVIFFGRASVGRARVPGQRLGVAIMPDPVRRHVHCECLTQCLCRSL